MPGKHKKKKNDSRYPIPGVIKNKKKKKKD